MLRVEILSSDFPPESEFTGMELTFDYKTVKLPTTSVGPGRQGINPREETFLRKQQESGRIHRPACTVRSGGLRLTLLGAMAGALQHAEVSVPRTYGSSILMGHNPRYLVQMS